ncbi:MAG: septation protein IspZ [Hyphomicrobiaceae bacterium]|nr:septation protein IspZ [Hyphomicrobiaceae bacterium]
MDKKKSWYPFTPEQTVNILSEFGPLVVMFVVNAIGGIEAGTWGLLVSTVVAMVVMRMVLGRLPIFPIIASAVTIVFGLLTIATGDSMWVKIKVSIFNAMFAGFLFGGLWATSPIMGRQSVMTVAGLTAIVLALQFPYFGSLASGLPALGDERNPLTTNVVCLSSMVVGFLLGGLVFKKNFFGHVFEGTFHYSQEGWDRFTYSFAWFFVFTAVLNEAVRQVFMSNEMYYVPVFGAMKGDSVWILFKLVFIMPVSGLYAWFLTKLMAKYEVPPPDGASHKGRVGSSQQPGSRPNPTTAQVH